MKNGYVICGLAYDAGHVVLAVDGLPPASIETTDWSQFPMIRLPRLLTDGTYFLMRRPGNAAGLYRSIEQVMDVADVYREGYAGVENHKLLLTAITNIRCGATDRVSIDFTLSPERLRLEEMNFFQQEEAVAWSAHLRCLEDPGCAEVYHRGR